MTARLNHELIVQVLTEHSSLTLLELKSALDPLRRTGVKTLLRTLRSLIKEGSVAQFGGNGGRYALPERMPQAYCDLEGRVLAALSREGGSATYGQLYAQLGIDRQLLTTLLERLLGRKEISTQAIQGCEGQVFSLCQPQEAFSLTFDPDLARQLLHTLGYYRRSLLANFLKHGSREVVVWHLEHLIRAGLVSRYIGENDARSVIYVFVPHSETRQAQALAELFAACTPQPTQLAVAI